MVSHISHGESVDPGRKSEGWLIWHRRTLTTDEASAYLKAVECLHYLPSKTGDKYDGAITRYDDFSALHIAMTYYAHYIVRSGFAHKLVYDKLNKCSQGPFYPWHRVFLWLYETALRDECGYDSGLQ